MYVNRMPRNSVPRVMKYYCPTGRRKRGRLLKRLLDTWDRNGSTSGPTPWKIYEDDEIPIYKHIVDIFIWLPLDWHRAILQKVADNGIQHEHFCSQCLGCKYRMLQKTRSTTVPLYVLQNLLVLCSSFIWHLQNAQCFSDVSLQQILSRTAMTLSSAASRSAVQRPAVFRLTTDLCVISKRAEAVPVTQCKN